MLGHEIDTSAASPDVVVPTIGADRRRSAGGALSGLVLAGVEFGACAPIYRAPVPITLPDKTSGFNGIAGHDLKD